MLAVGEKPCVCAIGMDEGGLQCSRMAEEMSSRPRAARTAHRPLGVTWDCVRSSVISPNSACRLESSRFIHDTGHLLKFKLYDTTVFLVLEIYKHLESEGNPQMWLPQFIIPMRADRISTAYK